MIVFLMCSIVQIFSVGRLKDPGTQEMGKERNIYLPIQNGAASCNVTSFLYKADFHPSSFCCSERVDRRYRR